jgi:hypothetical protein
MTQMNRIAEHPRAANVLAVGHRRGVHFSNDGGGHWQSLSTNMPTVPTSTVMFHPRDNALVAATYGRGIWVLDDAGPLVALTADAVKSDALFVSARRGRQWSLFNARPQYGEGEYYSPNPELDPTISYYVRDGAPGATIIVSDARGRAVRTMTAPAARGLNSVVWDMRMDPASGGSAPTGRGGGGRGGGGRGGGAGANAGPLVPPGKYQVAVRVQGLTKELRGDLTITGDPNDGMTAIARAARQKAIDDLYALQKSLDESRRASRASREAPPQQGRVDAELDRLMAIAGNLMRAIESFPSAPTADQRQQIAWATEDAAKAIAAARSPR